MVRLKSGAVKGDMSEIDSWARGSRPGRQGDRYVRCVGSTATPWPVPKQELVGMADKVASAAIALIDGTMSGRQWLATLLSVTVIGAALMIVGEVL